MQLKYRDITIFLLFVFAVYLPIPQLVCQSSDARLMSGECAHFPSPWTIYPANRTNIHHTNYNFLHIQLHNSPDNVCRSVWFPFPETPQKRPTADIPDPGWTTNWCRRAAMISDCGALIAKVTHFHKLIRWEFLPVIPVPRRRLWHMSWMSWKGLDGTEGGKCRLENGKVIVNNARAPVSVLSGLWPAVGWSFRG